MPNLKFFPTNDKNLLQVELQILKDTQIVSYGLFNPAKEGINNGPTPVNFDNIMEHEGNISKIIFIYFFHTNFKIDLQFIYNYLLQLFIYNFLFTLLTLLIPF